jgi:hypothetical protein
MSRYSKTKEEYYLTFYGHHDSNEPDILFTITNSGTTNYTSIPTIALVPSNVAIYTQQNWTDTQVTQQGTFNKQCTHSSPEK